MKIKVNESWKQESGKYKCPYCDKLYSKMGISTHIWRSHGSGKEFTANNDGYKKGTRVSWNKGLNMHDDERILKGRNTYLENAKAGKFEIKGYPHTEEFKQKMSVIAKKRKLGGVRQSKRILYNNVMLGSSYEVIVAKSLDANNIKWIIPNRIHYKDNMGKNRTYTPDFYLPDFDIYLDPKNDFLINNINPHLGFSDVDKIKWVSEQNHIKVLILNKKELEWEKIKLKIS